MSRRAPQTTCQAMHERVQLLGPARMPDGEGGYSGEPRPLTPAVVFAEVETLRGEDRLRAEASDVVISHVVRLRYHPQVGPHTRLVWRQSRVLEVIGAPVELGRRQVLECYCAERTA